MVDLSERIAALSPEQRALLQKRIAENNAAGANTRPELSRRYASSCGLSFSQQRLWFLDQFAPESSLYNVPSALRLTGALITALEQSLTEMVRRHESLRTTFALVDSEPVQIIHETSLVHLEVVDISGFEEEPQLHEANRLIEEEAQRPFDLEQGPLFRAALLRLSDNEHILLLTLHHIVSDAWSQGVLRRELSALYNAFSQGKPCLAGASDSVCRLRSLAAQLAAGRGAGAADRLLEAEPGRSPCAAGTAIRPGRNLRCRASRGHSSA